MGFNFDAQIAKHVPRSVERHAHIIARFLLVSTFFEDGVRMLMDWNEQVAYLTTKVGTTGAYLTLILCSSLQLVGGAIVVAMVEKLVEFAIGGLALNVLVQTLAYGLLRDVSLLFRNLALIGSLLMLASEYRIAKGKKGYVLAAPLMTTNTSTRYLQLAGRILIVLLVITHLPIRHEFNTANVAIALVVAIPLLFVVLGMQTRLSAFVLLVGVSVLNVTINSFWMLESHHPSRDFHQYYFFQTLSCMGGLMLLVCVGPGDLSVDEKTKKEF